jgi:hypothetical protein
MLSAQAPESVPPEESSAAAITPDDVELVRLARDTVIYAALSAGRLQPSIRQDGRGSLGYSPFLGRYLTECAPVFTRISKRELKDGQWVNRIRGCQAVGLVDPHPETVARMTVRSALASATRARKVVTGPTVFHKPIWPDEVGSLSLFVYVVEQLLPTKARTADELMAEGHDVRTWGLIAQAQGYRGAICGDLSAIPDVATQIKKCCGKTQNGRELRPHSCDEVMFIRMKGRWLWDPARPKCTFF